MSFKASVCCMRFFWLLLPHFFIAFHSFHIAVQRTESLKMGLSESNKSQYFRRLRRRRIAEETLGNQQKNWDPFCVACEIRKDIKSQIQQCEWVSSVAFSRDDIRVSIVGTRERANERESKRVTKIEIAALKDSDNIN